MEIFSRPSTFQKIFEVNPHEKLEILNFLLDRILFILK